MKENMIVLAQYWDGTATGSGSVQFVTSVPLKFHSGGVFSASSAGGSAKIRYAGTAQGTAHIKTESHSGSVLAGTAAFGTVKDIGGTAMTSLCIPKDGTVQFLGTASAAGAVMYIYAAFLVDEFGGTAYPAGNR